MSSDVRRQERESRISEITGLQREVSREAWETLSRCPNFVDAAELLGITERYLERLVFTEFRFLLKDEVPYSELASVLKDREEMAMKSVRSWLPNDEIGLLDEARQDWMVEEILKEFYSTSIISNSAERFALNTRDARDLLMLGLARGGLNLNQVSNMVDVSRERVRQILKEKFGFSSRENKAMMAFYENLFEELRMMDITTWVESHPGCTFDEIANAFNVEESEVIRLLPKSHKRLILLETRNLQNNANFSTFTREETLDALRLAYQLRNPSSSMYSSPTVRPLTGPSYDRYRVDGEVYGPSVPRILQIFGTWRTACEIAGVPSEEPVRSDYERRWTEQDLLEQVADFLIESENGSHLAFDEWCQLDNSRASGSTVRLRLQLSWSDVKREALRGLRQSWDTSQIAD